MPKLEVGPSSEVLTRVGNAPGASQLKRDFNDSFRRKFYVCRPRGNGWERDIGIVIPVSMPKVLARDLAWLSRPTPGFQLFQSDSQVKAQESPWTQYQGPLRKVAHKGTEVFVAVGNELRWADLQQLKSAGDVWERSHGMDEEDGEEEPDRRYRVNYTTCDDIARASNS